MIVVSTFFLHVRLLDARKSAGVRQSTCKIY